MKFLRALCSSILMAVVPTAVGAREPAAMDPSTQLLVVTTSNWDAVSGTLQRYQRDGVDGKWEPIGEPISVVVAKKGLAWGAGLVPLNEFPKRKTDDPVKQEGDTRAPAGLFNLSKSFGYALHQLVGWKMPYIPLTPTIECVDDVHSKYYNQVVDRAAVTPDWNSSEHMLYSNGQYRWGLVVDHNVDPVKPGGGSCIFMHIWLGTGEGTVGCTAMAQENIDVLMGWLDPAKKPLLLQLPRAQYKKLRRRWKLPKNSR